MLENSVPSEILKDSHSSLEIELTSKCTLECPGRPRVNRRSNSQFQESPSYWDHGHMDTELVKRIARDTSFRKYLFVGCYGDAIYHPDFLEICDYYQNTCKKTLMIHTNGSAKSKKFWDQAASMTWDNKSEFVFSVDGLEDTNHIYRVNAKWDQIMYGMKSMLSIPSARRPRMVWKFIVFPYNQHQVQQAQEMAIAMGFDEFQAAKTWRLAKIYRTDNPKLYDNKLYDNNVN